MKCSHLCTAVDNARQLLVGHLFGSTSGVRMLANSTHQVAVARLEVARNLLVLLTLMAQLSGQVRNQGALLPVWRPYSITSFFVIVQRGCEEDCFYVVKASV